MALEVVRPELQGSVPSYNKDDKEPTMNRRTFNKGVLAAAIGVVGAGSAAGILKLTSSGDRVPLKDKDTLGNRTVIVNGIEVDIDKVDTVDLYTNTEVPDLYRPWADPKIDLDLDIPGRTDAAGILVTPEVDTNEGLTLAIGHTLERIANAARDPDEYHKYKTQQAYTSWQDYVRNNFIKPMIDGLFPVKYEDPRFAGVDEGLIDFFMEFVDDYEWALSDSKRWGDKATLFVSTEFSELQDGILSDQSLVADIKVKRLGIWEGDSDIVYTGDMTVNVHGEEDGKYLLGIQQLHLLRE